MPLERDPAWFRPSKTLFSASQKSCQRPSGRWL